jgi:hypothetical protein
MLGADPKHIPSYVWRPNGYIYNTIGSGEPTKNHIAGSGEVILSDPATGLLLR